MKSPLVLAAVLFACFLSYPAIAQEKKDTAQVKDSTLTQLSTHSFVGARKCLTCHNTAKSGYQYKIWKESRHAQAYQTLATDKAKEYGKARGVDDPQKADACLKCHVTGYTAPASLKTEKYSIEDGVSCESCHGAGGDYWKKETMTAIRQKKLDGKTVGLTIPDEALCRTCHNPESPGYKEFTFSEYHAKIVHKIPQ